MVRKRSERAAERREKAELALKDLGAGVFTSVKSAARAYGAAEATVRGRWKGGRSQAEGNEWQQLLTSNEERALVKWITELTVNGFPPRAQTIREMAEEIRRRRVTAINDASIELVHYDPIGMQWSARFLARHPELQCIYARRIDVARLKESTPETIQEWFNTFERVKREYNVAPKNIYNMDETGFAIGSVERGKVIINAQIRSQFQANPGRQEWVTAIECICGDGSAIDPLLIFKGAKIGDWVRYAHIPDTWSHSCSNKGWTSDIHGLQWLRQCFEPATREKANGGYRILVLDGHGSHVTGGFIAHCMDYKIVLLRLPPHTSHVLQPLDVGIFKPLKTYLSSKLDPTIRTQVARLQKPEWVDAYVEARAAAFTPGNIWRAWRGAGLFPFNPDRVLRHIRPPVSSVVSSAVLRVPSTPQTPESSIPIDPQLFETSLLHSSPPNATILRRTNTALTTLIETQTPLFTPARKYVRRLTAKTEQLHAENSILKTRLTAATDLLSARQNRTKGKAIALKDQLILTTDQIRATITELEKEEEERKVKKQKRSTKNRGKRSEIDIEEADESDSGNYILPEGILNCIEVQLSE
jgi:hypothetical protein